MDDGLKSYQEMTRHAESIHINFMSTLLKKVTKKMLLQYIDEFKAA